MKIIAENREERLDICKTCPFYNAKKDKCTKCGCRMAWKATLVHAKCPIKLWGCPGCDVK